MRAVLQNPRLQAPQRVTPRPYTPNTPALPPAAHPVLRFASVFALVIVAALGWLYAGTSVTITTQPLAQVEILDDGPFGPRLRLGSGWLLFPGNYRVRASAAGYRDLEQAIAVPFGAPRRFTLTLLPKPGVLRINTTPRARLRVDGKPAGESPRRIELDEGVHEVRADAEFFHAAAERIRIVGKGREQQLVLRLRPASARLTIPTVPSGAEVRLGDRVLGRAGAPVRVPAGDHLLVLKLPGYRAKGVPVQVVAGQDSRLASQTLERANGLVEVLSTPSSAFVLVDGAFRGITPLELSLQPGREVAVAVRKPGYRDAGQRVAVRSEGDVRVQLALQPEYGNVAVDVHPADAEVWVDGAPRGKASAVTALRLDTRPHVIEARRNGLVSQRATVVPRPTLAQAVRLHLVSVEDARRVSSARELRTAAGQRLRLVYPQAFRMGSPAREPGRRSNEVLREVELTRPYYLATVEVSNGEFRRFRAGHDSGEYQSVDLNDDRLPVVNLSWADAVAYCNWLSAQEGLAPFYRTSGAAVTGVDPTSTGYRLPTEAEWEFASRYSPAGLLRFPWGMQLPPPNRTGNYADRAAAAIVGRILVTYVDGAVGTAPVGRFDASALGIRDLGGNVAEWAHDFYEVPGAARVANPLGPASGQYHVIKGSSFLHGTATELRLAFRDFGRDPRADVGFRIARYAE